jgi:hypothetical protein
MTDADAGRESLREAFQSDAEILNDGERCPPTERIWRSAEGELDRPQNESLLRHLGECGACAASWRLARDLSESSGKKRAPVAAGRGSRFGDLPMLAMAAALVLAVALGSQLFGPRRTEAPAFRNQQAEWLTPVGEDGGSLPRGQFLLRWAEGPEGSTYDIRVTTEDLDLLATGRRLEQAEYQVPADALEDLPGGAAVYWQVTAHLPGGRSIDSDSFLTRIE